MRDKQLNAFVDANIFDGNQGLDWFYNDEEQTELKSSLAKATTEPIVTKLGIVAKLDLTSNRRIGSTEVNNAIFDQLWELYGKEELTTNPDTRDLADDYAVLTKAVRDFGLEPIYYKLTSDHHYLIVKENE